MAELERRFPERTMLRASDPEGLRAAWAMIEATWAATLAQALALPESTLLRASRRRVEFRRNTSPSHSRDGCLASADGEGNRTSVPPVGIGRLVAD